MPVFYFPFLTGQPIIRIMAESTGSQEVEKGSVPAEAFVLVKRIRASEHGFCRLETPTELTCKALSCGFSSEYQHYC